MPKLAHRALEVTPVYEMDYDGGIGNIMGAYVPGHADFDDIELLLADGLGEFYYEDNTPRRGFDVRHVWMRMAPLSTVDIEPDEEFADNWVYVWDTDDSKGGEPVTLFEEEHTTEARCFRHPMEVGYTGHQAKGMHSDDQQHADSHGTIWLCKECSDDYNRRLQEAYDEAAKEAQ